MTGKLDGKVALVTGAGRGIGKAIAERLARDGAEVIINYSRSADRADALAAQIGADGGKAWAVGADVSDLDQIATMFATIAQRHPTLDILVNNAGRGSNGMPTLDKSTPEDFEAMFALNTRGLFFATQGAARLMPDGGRIVNFSSTSTTARVPGLSIYAGSKAAVEAFTRIWAAELAPRRITVNAILPGITDTDLIRNNLPPQMAEQIAKSVPLGRMGLPEDMANLVAFLVSSDGSWITGQSIVSNGGSA
ncbi:MAG: glucose 1-dehydrogenase [Rudaea sp.]|nr:glucose 1-dehydrogenase [Rudaea sp.]